MVKNSDTRNYIAHLVRHSDSVPVEEPMRARPARNVDLIVLNNTVKMRIHSCFTQEDLFLMNLRILVNFFLPHIPEFISDNVTSAAVD